MRHLGMFLRTFIGLSLGAILTAAFLYLSQFWVYRLWTRADLEGTPWLAWARPDGDLVTRWLRALPRDVVNWGDYAVIIWGVGAFLVLTLLQWIWGKVFG